MESMKTRLITSAIGVPLAILLLVLGEFFHWIMYAAIAILCAFMIIEFLSAQKLHKDTRILVPCLLYAFLQPLLIAAHIGKIPFFIFVVILLLMMLIFHEELNFSDVSFSVLGTLIITWGMSSMLVLPNAYGKYFSMFFVFCLGIPWFSDAGAYFAGVYLGRTKLCPKVSPKKTVEGFIGGLFAGTIASLLIGFFFSLCFSELQFNYALLILMGAAGSAISVLGDLTFSLVKRASGIKDYGSIFPGHGGFLDRFDSVIFAAPLVYFFALYFPLIAFKLV